MTNVTFAGGRFRNTNGRPTVFTKLSMTSVLFRDIRWEATTDVTFREFAFRGVIFRRNAFDGGVTFTEGSSSGLIFRDCTSGRRGSGLLPSVETFALTRMSANTTKILGCTFAGPAQLAAVAVRGMDVVNSTFGSSLSCVDAEDSRKLLDATRLQFLNSTIGGALNCTGAKLTTSAFSGVTVGAGANFDRGIWENVALVDVAVPSTGRSCLALSFVGATLKGDGVRGGQMRNVTVGCLLSLRSAVVEGVAWTAVTSERTDYAGAIFRQEFVGPDCCTVLCEEARCKCDVSSRTVCPRGSREVRFGARACLLGGSTVMASSPTVDGARSAAAADPVPVAVRQLDHGWVVRDGVDGAASASPIYLFSHRTPVIGRGGADVVTLETVGGHALTITSGHLVYVAAHAAATAVGSPRAAAPATTLVAASSVAVGDALLTANGSAVAVVSARPWVLPPGADHGLYAPHSVSGSLVVDGLRVSCWTTAVRPSVAVVVAAPARAAYALWGVRGVRWMSGLEGGGLAAALDRWWPL